MSINYEDISFVGEQYIKEFARQLINKKEKELKDNNDFSERTLSKLFEKYSYDKIFKSEYETFLIHGLILSCISEYHDQIRNKLLENGIDIGEIDMEAQPLRIKLLKNINGEDNL